MCQEINILEENFNEIQETDYLFHSPNNAERLRESIKQYEDGKTKCSGLIDDEK